MPTTPTVLTSFDASYLRLPCQLVAEFVIPDFQLAIAEAALPPT
jgi:hypothetical protein